MFSLSAALKRCSDHQLRELAEAVYAEAHARRSRTPPGKDVARKVLDDRDGAGYRVNKHQEDTHDAFGYPRSER